MGKDVRPDWDRERLADVYVLRKYVYGVVWRVLQPWWVIAARRGLRLADGPGAVAPAGGGRLTVNVYYCAVRPHGCRGMTPPTSRCPHRLLRV